MTVTPWLSIDLKGFAATLADKGVERIALEPISNAFDTEATEIDITFTHAKGWAGLRVADNDPDGFARLADAWTLYAPSTRSGDPTKRGRFGQGEKELVAICSTGGYITIVSTTGTVIFDSDGRRTTKAKTDAGSTLTAKFRCTMNQARYFEDLVESLIIPDKVKVTSNGRLLERPDPVKTFEATLPTFIEDSTGRHPTRRKTTVEIFEPRATEAWIFELGVPVVVHDGRYDINVGQKVPLNRDRDNITPAYLKALREHVLNQSFENLSADDFKSAWVTEASPAASPEALRTIVEGIHGPNAVIFDPNNLEANKLATDQGRAIVYGRQFTKDTWRRIKEHEILKPSGQVIQTGIPTSPDGVPPIPHSQWTEAMDIVEIYVKALGRHLLDFTPVVDFHNIMVSTDHGHAAAWYGGRTVTFNLRILGKAWPETVGQESLDALLLHEFAHEKAPEDHYSPRFYGETCRLGAKLRGCNVTLGTR